MNNNLYLLFVCAFTTLIYQGIFTIAMKYAINKNVFDLIYSIIKKTLLHIKESLRPIYFLIKIFENLQSSQYNEILTLVPSLLFYSLKVA